MYILFEISKSDPEVRNEIFYWDCMGYAVSEEDAISWVAKNRDYRCYKYCPDKIKN